MKILLVNPPYFDVWRTFDFVLPPLGLAYMAAVLNENSYEVSILDLNAGQDQRLMIDNHWDLVGITLDTSRYYKGIDYAQMLKARGAKVVVGGPHASFMAEELLGKGFADFVVRGEGERTMLELVRALLQNVSPEDEAQTSGLAELRAHEGHVAGAAFQCRRVLLPVH